MTTTIKMEKIVAAIVALKRASTCLYGHNEDVLGETCLAANVGLEHAIRNIQVAVDTEPEEEKAEQAA